MKATKIFVRGVTALIVAVSTLTTSNASAGAIASADAVSPYDPALRTVASTVSNARAMTELDRMFAQGRALKATGQLDAAIRVFREILRLEPDYLNARRELAHSLMLAREFTSAQFHFEELLRIDKNERMRAGYRQFLDFIGREKPFGISGFASIVPSSNINRGTYNSVFTTTLGPGAIAPSFQAMSGIGAQLGVSGFYQLPELGNAGTTLNWTLSGVFYEDSQFNAVSGSVSATRDVITHTGTLTVSPYLRTTIRGDDADSHAIGAQFEHSNMLSEGRTAATSFRHEARRYPHQTHLDGPFSTVALHISQQVDQSLNVKAGIALEHHEPSPAHLQYDGLTASLSASKLWSGGWDTDVTLAIGQRTYAGIYPLLLHSRDDEFVEVNFGVLNSNIEVQGFSPKLDCKFLVTRSNVDLFDANTTECGVSLTREF